jgi:hypothetical protein
MLTINLMIWRHIKPNAQRTGWPEILQETNNVTTETATKTCFLEFMIIFLSLVKNKTQPMLDVKRFTHKSWQIYQLALRYNPIEKEIHYEPDSKRHVPTSPTCLRFGKLKT